MKRIFALLICAILLLTMFPVSALAVDAEPADIWEQIAALEEKAAAKRGAVTLEARAAAYSGIVDRIIALVEGSETFVPGSIVRHGDFFYWDETDGTACGYSPRLRAEIREGADPKADPEAYAAIDTVSYGEKGGYPQSTTVSAFQPYVGIDSSFSAQYENRCNAIAQALGGTGTTYKTTNATIDNIAQALETSAVVIFDSHGDTDYASGYDYTSRANTSYICLQSGTGITTADQATVQGPYGSYKHAYYAGSYGQMHYYCVDGTAITNHMSEESPNGLLWMAICLGMATDGLQAPIRARGVEVAYGYSQSVTFAGDYAWEARFWQKMIEGAYVKDAIAYMKQQVGCPDPYTSSYPAYPIVVSSEDVYPGHGNVDAQQTVYSTWTLFTQFEINAVPNNPAWGSVSVSATKITATPAYGYYVDDYEILEGQATVTRDGNVFTVDPQSDCTIQINFASRDPAVVHFSVPEGVTCADINAYVGDEITLPTPTGEPAVESRSFRFVGWVEAPMAEDSLDEPAFLAPRAKVKLTQVEKTYYALYTYFVAVDGLEDDQFVRVDEAPHSWAGEYVLTYNGQYALAARTDCMGNTVSNRLGVKKAVVDLAAAGLTYEDNILSGVTPEITYVVESIGDGKFTVKMKTVNHYMAMASASESLTTYTSSNSDKTRWTISYGANGPKITNAQYPAYSVQYDVSGKVFKAFSSAQKPLTLFKKAEGENWFTTDPREKTVCEEHVFGDWETVTEPTCTEPGLRKRTCTVCGYTETEALDPLGHDYAAVVTEPTCTEGGFTTYTCSRCGDTYAADETDALGHDWIPVPGDYIVPCPEPKYVEYICARCGATYTETIPGTEHQWDEGVVTTPPTATEPGVMTYTCTVCGATREEEIPVLEHACAISQFADVMEAYPDPESPEHQAIEWAFTHEPQITSGMNETTFGVGQTLTRAQAATFLYAAAGKPEFDAENAENPFADVKLGKWYTVPVLWAASEGLFSGYADGSFQPNTTLSRGQILVILYAWAGKPSVEGLENPYTDVPAGKWFTDAAIWAYHAGIEGGADGKFVQSDPCFRESMVLYLYRCLEHKCLTNE